MMRGATTITAGTAALLLLFATSAHAYIDPGTGTLAIQMLLAAIAGILFYFRTIIRKIKGLFKSPQARDSPAADNDRVKP